MISGKTVQQQTSIYSGSMARKIAEHIPLTWIYVPALLVSANFVFGGPWSIVATTLGKLVFGLAIAAIVCQIFQWKAALFFLEAFAVIYWTATAVLLAPKFRKGCRVNPEARMETGRGAYEKGPECTWDAAR